MGISLFLGGLNACPDGFGHLFTATTVILRIFSWPGRLRAGVKTQCGSVANVPSVVNTHQQGLATGGRQEYTLELGELVSVMSVLMHISLSRDTESPIGTSADTEEIF